MANDKVAIWNGGLKFGRSPANGELLIGDGAGLNLSTLSAGSGVSITNSAGGISISATGSGGTVTSVTATSPLASSGGTTPDISLGTVPVNNGGTGATSLTLNNVILGNGTSSVQFVAPGASGNVLTSNGTTWASAAAPSTWTLLKKVADQTLTNNVVLTNVTDLTFTMAANTTYAIRFMLAVTSAANGHIISITGPAIGIGKIRGNLPSARNGSTAAVTSYGATLATTINITALFDFQLIIQNGANAGTFAPTFSQSTSGATNTTIEKGSWLEYAVIA